MKIVIFAMLIYGVYLLLRYLFRSMAGQTPKNKSSRDEKPRRTIDPNNIEDADFEEIKKDK